MKIKTLSFLITALLMWGCGGSGENESNGAATVADSTDADTTPVAPLADFKFHSMIANLPSPLETFHTISHVNLEMSGVELTPVSQAGTLGTMSKKAYGYGIYMTDMGFMAYQHHNQQTLEYLQTCRELAQNLGAGEVFDRTVSQNFEENTSSEENFVRMMDEAFSAMDDYMVNNERFVNATEIFVGSWVETQLIATRILRGKPLDENNKAVYEGVYAQKKHASNLMNVLGEIDAEVDEQMLTAVEDLMMFYAGFSSIESITQEDLSELEQKLQALKGHLIS